MITYSQCHGHGGGDDGGDDDVSFEFSLNERCKNKESWLKESGFSVQKNNEVCIYSYEQ